MTRTCSFARAGFSGKAEWQLDDSALVLTPDGLPPEVYPLRELQSLAGDGYEIRLGALTLSRLGAEGPTLLDTLRRRWLAQRAEGLRLTGLGEAHPFTGALAGMAAEGGVGGGVPFHALLFDDLLLLAAEGQDIQPVFLAQLSAIGFDEATYSLSLSLWSGAALVLAKLAGRTEEFLTSIRSRRAALALEAASFLGVNLPGLPGDQRTGLTGLWPPGRLLSLAEMEGAGPGFLEQFRAEWLPRLVRRAEAEDLFRWAAEGNIYLGYSRPESDTTGRMPEEQAGAAREGNLPGATAGHGAGPLAAAAAAPRAAPGAATGGDAGTATESAGGGAGPGQSQAEPPKEQPLLWLLAGKDDRWLLEALSDGDHATYCFQAGPEMPGLASSLLCAPQFSREALYLPLTDLVGGRADLGLAARELGLLKALRRRFAGRLIHGDRAKWQAGLDAPGSPPPPDSNPPNANTASPT